MFSSSILLFCSFFQIGDGIQPSGPGLLPAVSPRQQRQVEPVVSPAQPLPPTVPGHFTTGILELPTHNRVVLAAPERAVLRVLQTELRDAEGNIVRNSEGNMVMVPIRRGMNVFAGQVVANFDDLELHATKKINQAQLEVALSEKEKEIEVTYAAWGVAVAKQEYEGMVAGNKIVARTFPEMDVLKARLSYIQAEANLELQKYNIQEVKTREVAVRESELERTEVQIHNRKLIAPIDGMIVNVGAAEGMWLREGDPVVEIVQLDTMWVRVAIPIGQYQISELDGKQATVRVRFANGKTETFEGPVFFCDPTVKAGNTFDIYIELQNRRVGNYWILQPGHGGGSVDTVIAL